MTPQELRDRTMTHALAVYNLTKPLMQMPSSRHVAHQLFRVATAVAANYRAACLGRSPQEFVAKLGLVREEADEVVFWPETAALRLENWRQSSPPRIARRSRDCQTETATMTTINNQ